MRWMLARSRPDCPAPAAVVPLPPPAQPVVSPDGMAFDDAVESGDWARSVTSLATLAMPKTRLAPLTIDQLRLLQDAVTRAHSAPDDVSRVLQLAIAVELHDRGVLATNIVAGTAFGTIEIEVDKRIDGDNTTSTWYTYKINLRFRPDAALIDADEIAFIQTVRLIDTASGSNLDPEETNKKRQTPSATSVDRRRGKKQGWYGMNDDGTGTRQLTTWKKSAAVTPATMQDHSSWNEPNTTWQFEAMVVCRCGPDAGKVYAVVTWGFTVDADLKVTELAPTVTNKQSTEATAAVRNWNAQAAGSPFDRNASDQMSLPALR